MNISQSLLEALQANGSLTALVSTRVFSGILPIGVTDALGPWLVYSRISNSQETALDGDGNLSRTRYQFTVGSSIKTSVDSVRDALVSMNGTEFTAQSGQKLTLLHQDDHDHFDAETRIWSAIVDFYIWANT